MIYFTDFGVMTLAHRLAELHVRLVHRTDDDESQEICRQATDLMSRAEKLLEDRWEWSKNNPPAILGGKIQP